MCVCVCVCVFALFSWSLVILSLSLCVRVCVRVCMCVCVCILCSAVQLNGCSSQIEMQTAEIVRLRECIRPFPLDEAGNQSQSRLVSIVEEVQLSELNALKSKVTSGTHLCVRCVFHTSIHQVSLWRRKKGKDTWRVS